MVINYGTEIPNLERRKCIVINPVNYVININGMIFTLYKIIIMKNIKTLLALLLINTHLFSQDPPIPNINNLTPKWYHVIRDSNFVQDTFGNNIRNEYTVCSPNLYKTIDNQLLINSYCIHGYGAYHGNMINKIDLNTGKMQWTRALNNDNYLLDQEFFPSLFYDRLSNDVVLNGFKKIAPLEVTWSLKNQPSLSTSIRLNFDTGIIHSHTVNENVSDTILWNVFKGNFIQTASNHYYYLERMIDFEKFQYTMYGIEPNQHFFSSPDLTFTKPNIGTYYYNASIENILSDSDFNDNLYSLILNNYTGKDDSISASLIKFKIKESGSVENSKLDVMYEKELKDYFYLPESPFGFIIRHLITDDAVYISGGYLDTLDNKIKVWILGLDSLGNEKFYIKTLTFDGNFFPFGISFVGKKNNKVYLIVNGDDYNESRILMSIDDNGQMKQHAILKSEDPKTKSGIFHSLFTENNELVLIARTYEKYNHVVCYDVKDFNIDFSNAVDDDSEGKEKYDIYPNPATDYITIHSKIRDYQGSTVVLTDTYGSKIKSQFMTDVQSQIDISNLPVGMYFVSVISANGKAITTSKIIKL